MMTDNISVTYIGYQCLECGRKFSAPQSLRNHSRMHEVKQRYECHDCGKIFRMEFYYRYHRLNDLGEYSLECGVCGKMFSNVTCLDTHYKIHTNEKWYKCKMCGKIYSQLGGFRNHLSGHPKTFNCNECGEVCTDSRNLEKHLEKHALKRKSEKQFVCMRCGEGFAHLFNLEIHMNLCYGSESQIDLLKSTKFVGDVSQTLRFSELDERDVKSQEAGSEVEVIDLLEESDYDTEFLPLEVCINEGDEVLSLCDSRD